MLVLPFADHNEVLYVDHRFQSLDLDDSRALQMAWLLSVAIATEGSARHRRERKQLESDLRDARRQLKARRREAPVTGSVREPASETPAKDSRGLRGDFAGIIGDTARAAGVFASGGRDVFVDGVVGPWFVPVLARELTSLGVSLDYVVLRAGSDETLARAGICEKPPSETIVRKMQAAFADLGELERHAVDTDGHTPQQTLAQVRRRGLSGDFQLDLARYSS